MRLKRLYDYRGLTLNEDDTGLPEEANRHLTIRKHMLAKPKQVDPNKLDQLLEKAYEYPPGGENPNDYMSALKAMRQVQEAFKTLLEITQTNPVSGLPGSKMFSPESAKADVSARRRQELGKKGPGDFIIISADIDNASYLNSKSGLGTSGVNSIFGYIGDLFKEAFQMDSTEAFHLGGDEFRVVSNISKLDDERKRIKFIHLLKGCMKVANKLTSTGFYQEGWDDSRRVQPTISFGISRTDTSADGILTHVKTGASGGKPMKYAITIDRDLRYDLGFTPEAMNQYIGKLGKTQDKANISLVDPPEVMVYESRMPMENVRNNKGAVFLECSWDEIPPHRKKDLEALRKQKRGYLQNPEGAMRIDEGVYIPLKEKNSPPSQ